MFSVFRNCLLSTSPIAKFGIFGNRQTRLFLITSFPLYGTSFRLPTGENVFHRYSLNFIFTRLISFLLVDSRYNGKPSYSDDLVQVVPNSCIMYIFCLVRKFSEAGAKSDRSDWDVPDA